MLNLWSFPFTVPCRSCCQTQVFSVLVATGAFAVVSVQHMQLYRGQGTLPVQQADAVQRACSVA